MAKLTEKNAPKYATGFLVKHFGWMDVKPGTFSENDGDLVSWLDANTNELILTRMAEVTALSFASDE
jgi:hypothetical protein